ncbi:hypothetical protein GCM10009589_20600 [Arthrobacter pascens]
MPWTNAILLASGQFRRLYFEKKAVGPGCEEMINAAFFTLIARCRALAASNTRKSSLFIHLEFSEAVPSRHITRTQGAENEASLNQGPGLATRTG